MKKGLVLVFICGGYLLLGPSSIALSPTTSDTLDNLSHFTPVSPKLSE
ncbi:hypothetical protein [Fictibacillus phosphorivorans]|nr:hypothetical protein [Fictibacillus phosphorivorans]